MRIPTREEMLQARLVKVVLAAVKALGGGFHATAEVRAALADAAERLKQLHWWRGSPGPVFARCSRELASAGVRVTPARTKAARGFLFDLEGSR